LSCSEYKLNPEEDIPNEGEDTSERDQDDDTGNSEVDACSNPEDPGTSTVNLNEECEVDLSKGSFTPVVEWTYGNQMFCGPAAVGQMVDTNGSGDVDSDDTPLVVIYQSGAVVALLGDSGTPAWTSGSGYGSYGSSAGNGDFGGLAIGDVDGDAVPDVVTVSTNMVCALDGATGAELWCQTSMFGGMDPYGFSYPAIADMDGDGAAEVTVGATILNGVDGSIRGRGQYGIGAAPYYQSTGTYGANSVPIDLDNDGILELVTGNAAYDADGNTIWYNGGLDGLIAVADFDGDGEGEIVKTSGAYVIGMDTDGTELWETSHAAGSYLAIGTPAIDDLDGDDEPEIVYAVQNDLIAIEWGGTKLWTASISDYTGAAGPSLFDFEMDGYPEVLYQDETDITFFSGLDGTVKYSSSAHGSVTILETPIVADVDGDDQVEIVVSHCDYHGAYKGVTVFGDADETWPPGRKFWNQHAYYITNIDDDGTVPSPTEPNYSLYNSFRSGDIGRPPEEYWDLLAQVLDVCEDECDEGTVYVAARMKNAGNIDAPSGIPISLRAGAGGTIIATEVTTDEIASGSTGEMVVFEVAASLIEGFDPIVTADENSVGYGEVYECDESNNTENWGDTVCD